MQLIDTHCHLDFKDYNDDLDEVINRALSNGVTRIIVPGTDLDSSARAVTLANKYTEVYAAVGVHPHAADDVPPDVIQKLKGMILGNDKVVAVGEIGLDYYRNYSKSENQKSLFHSSLKLACELDLPVIVHNRNADEDVLAIIDQMNRFALNGVVHCFSGSLEFLKKIISSDMYVSFAGNITFPKARDIRELAEKVPLEKLLLETDAPFMTPEPLRGKRNEPSFVRYLLKIYSNIYGLEVEDIARITTHNADKLFHLGLKNNKTIVYKIRNSLYINVTNRCTNRCCFCTRDMSDYVKGHDLKLDADPTIDEITAAIGDASIYNEIVFCGFGEPTLRLETIKKVAAFVKPSGVKIRLVTNGVGNLINGLSVAKEIRGLVDQVSVSVNASNEELYQSVCRPAFGKEAYSGIVNFVRECREEDIEVEITCLDFVGEKVVEDIKRFATENKATFRLRHLNVVG